MSLAGRHARIRLILPVLAVASLLAAACAPRGGLDVPVLETDIRSELVGGELGRFADHLGDVTCPESLNPEPGDRVDCAVSISGQTARIEVVFGAARGAIQSAALLDRVVDIAGVEQAIASTFAADLGTVAEVRCPAPVMVLPAGQSVDCDVVDDRGVTRTLAATPASDGTIEISFSAAPR